MFPSLPTSFPQPTSVLWDPPRLRRLVAFTVLYLPECFPRAIRVAWGIFTGVLLIANVTMSLFVLGIYSEVHSIAACTDLCHSLCSLASYPVLVYLMESGRLRQLLCMEGMDSDLQASLRLFDRRFHRLVLRMAIMLYSTLGLIWWVYHFPQWMPGGSFWARYGQWAFLCGGLNTITAWIWYSGPICVMMLMLSVLWVHEALLDNLVLRIEQKTLLPSRAAVIYHQILKSLEVRGSELQFTFGFFLMASMLAFSTLVASLYFTSGPKGFGPSAAYSTEELRVVLQTMVLVGWTVATVVKGAIFTSKARCVEMTTNRRLLQAGVADPLRESLAVQQIQRQRGGWFLWGIHVNNAMMVKILTIYGAGAYYLVTVCVRWSRSQEDPHPRP